MQPTVTQRDAQHYVAIGGAVPMAELAKVAERTPEVFAWLAARGIEPDGPPFFKYDVIDMDGDLQVEVGVAVARPVAGEGEVVGGVLPGGRYATVTHVGHPDTLYDATRDLLAWAEREGLVFDMTRTPQGERWAGRVEFYESDPRDEPDLTKWRTTLAFKLVG
jgi:DNA gyrase inhibitor GyrI